MPEFEYTARNESGARVTGLIDAENEAAVVRVLDEKKLFPIFVTGKKARAQIRFGPTKRRIRARDIGLFYSQLADLLGAGVPLLLALDALIRSTVSPRLVFLVREVRKEVADGKSLTDALRQHPEAFPPLHTAMVQAGERASFLEEVFRSLANFVERLDELRSKVLGAMIYPALLTVIGLTVMLIALVVFVPRFEPLLSGVNRPLPTEIIFGLSRLVRGYWFVVLLALAGLAGSLWSALKSPTGRRLVEQVRLRLPVVGLSVRMVAITRFCRILGTMLTNGVPLLQALAISKNATGSPLMADRVGEALESVREGKSLTGPLKVGGLFPEQILAMLTVAEQSNSLEKVLLQIADTVERRTSRQVDQAVRLVEPVILCVVAAGIGFLALGLLIPVFTMASSLGQR
jgi:general secretion pathway protein F